MSCNSKFRNFQFRNQTIFRVCPSFERDRNFSGTSKLINGAAYGEINIWRPLSYKTSLQTDFNFVITRSIINPGASVPVVRRYTPVYIHTCSIVAIYVYIYIYICIYQFRRGRMQRKDFYQFKYLTKIENMPIFKRKIQCTRRFNSVCLYAFQIAMHYVIQFNGSTNRR